MKPDSRIAARVLATAVLLALGAPAASADTAVQFTTHPDPDIQPAWSPDGLEIAYAHGTSDAWDIWAQPVAGGAHRVVVEGPGNETYPTWSPDGLQIAYPWAGSIWTVPAAGGTPVEITVPRGGNQPDSEPCWSPLGHEIAFVSRPTISEAENIYRMAVVNGAEFTIAISHGGHREPSWSPDGTQIVYRRVSGGDHLFAVDVATFVETYILADAAQPAWSPDGGRIACMQGGDIWLYDADGTNGVQLTDDPANDRYPTWSPDGTRIAFDSERTGNYDIWIVDLADVPAEEMTWSELRAQFR